VESIWKASGEGQYLPSGSLPLFHPEPPKLPQGARDVVGYVLPCALSSPQATLLRPNAYHSGPYALTSTVCYGEQHVFTARYLIEPARIRGKECSKKSRANGLGSRVSRR